MPGNACLVTLQATMAELQEVQITEEKPLLPGQAAQAAKVIRDPLPPAPQSIAGGQVSPGLLTSQAHPSDSNPHPTFFSPSLAPSSLHLGTQALVLSLH